MPAAIPVIAVAIATKAGLGTLGVALMGMASSLVAGMLQRAMQPSSPTLGTGLRVNSRSVKEPLKLVYGEVRVGGNDVFIGSTGPTNGTLHIVQTLADGECEGIAQDGDGHDLVYLGDKLAHELQAAGAPLSYTFHEGSAAQSVDSGLNGAFPEWTDPMQHTAYIVWALGFSPDHFSGLPERTVVLKGLKLYDFRTGTTGFSKNPVLELYHYLTDVEIGRGVDPSKIDVDSFTEAANYCDAKGFECSVGFADESSQTIIDTICAHFRGGLTYFGGKYYCRYADLNYESTVFNLEDEHLALDGEGLPNVKISQPSGFNKPDGLRVAYVDASKGYVEDEVVVGEDEGVVESFALPGVQDRESALILGNYELERRRLNRGIAGTFRGDAVQLDPYDVVTVSVSKFGISGQQMRVSKADALEGGLVGLELQYESAVLYNDIFDSEIEGVYESNLPDPFSEPPAVSSPSLSEEQYHYRLRTFTRLKVSFTAPGDYPWFDFVEVRVSQDGVDWEHLFNAREDFWIDPVEEGARYYVRLKTVNINGVKQKDENDVALSLNIQGYVDVPESLGSLEAVVNDNSINLYSAKVSDPDVELYEFRTGPAWDGAIFLGALRSPNLSLKGVKPGQHIFWANTLSNNSQYGAAPVSMAVELPDPPHGWSLVGRGDLGFDISGADFENCEQITYNSEYYLRRLDNACLNGGFENGDWSNWTDFGTIPSKNVTSLHKVVGAYSAELIFDGTSDGGGVFQTIRVEAGKTYRLSGWMKIGLVYSAGYSFLDVMDGALTEILATAGALTGPTALWQPVSVEFTVPAGETHVVVRCGVWYYLDTPNMTARFDEVRLEKKDLSCTWTSPIFDGGEVLEALTYYNTGFVQEGGGNTWDDVFPSGALWSSKGVGEKKWYEIFGESGVASRVEISLYYGETSPPASRVGMQEILSAIAKARYRQLEVKITDPQADIRQYVRYLEWVMCT